jgi:hypothetical protein
MRRNWITIRTHLTGSSPRRAFLRARRLRTGRLERSPALPGAVHDLTAARTHGIIDALTRADVMTFAE